MNTATRRERLLHLLYRRAATVPEIARDWSVSERTIYRDVAALRDAGHAIQASPGRGGGLRMAPDSKPRPVHFEVSEIIGLALSVAMLRAMPHMPFVASAEAALDRARLALSPERRRSLERLERRVLVGSPASPGVQGGLGEVDKGVLSTFEPCFTAGRAMRFAYEDAKGARSQRRVECMGLVLHAPAWYVLAWDLEKDAPRLFRMDRMAGAEVGERVAAHALRDAMSAMDGMVDSGGRRAIADG